MMTREIGGRLIKAAVCSTVATSGGLGLYRRCRRRGTLNILMFHKVNTGKDPLGLTISPDVFARQVQYLKEQYVLIPLSEAVDRLQSSAIDRDYTVITFDDGYRDNYTEAYPILKSFRASATIFVTHDAVESGTTAWHRVDTAIRESRRELLDLTGFGLGRFSLESRREREQVIGELHRRLKKMSDADRQAVAAHVFTQHGDPAAGERIMLSWDEIREMQQDGLMSIGSHTLSHPILTRVPKEAALAEVRDSKVLLEEKLGRPVEFFAYPNGGRGDFNEDIVAMVKGCGYRAALSTIPPRGRVLKDLFSLPRTDITPSICRGIDGRFSKQMFAVRVSGMLDGILFRS